MMLGLEDHPPRFSESFAVLSLMITNGINEQPWLQVGRPRRFLGEPARRRIRTLRFLCFGYSHYVEKMNAAHRISSDRNAPVRAQRATGDRVKKASLAVGRVQHVAFSRVPQSHRFIC